MKRSAIALLLVAVITCLDKVAPAQEANGIPQDIVATLDSIVGTWSVEGNVGDKKHSGEFTLRWQRTEDNKKVCLLGRFSFVTGGEPRSGVTLIGWNAANKCIEDRGFDANGGNGVLYWTIESPTHWRGETVAARDGETMTGKSELIKKSDSEYVMESEYDNGDVSRIVLRKEKRQRKKKAKD